MREGWGRLSGATTRGRLRTGVAGKVVGRGRGAGRGGSVEEEKKRFIRQLFLLSSTGLSMVLAIFIGLAFGVFLGREARYTPSWFTLIFLGLGIIAGFRNIFWFIRHYGTADDKKDKKGDGQDD